MKKATFKKVVMPGVMVISSLFFVPGSSFAAELDDIKAAIKEKGARWVAGETSISKLPPDLKKLRLGHIVPQITGTERLVSAQAPVTGLRSSLDWRLNPRNSSQEHEAGVTAEVAGHLRRRQPLNPTPSECRGHRGRTSI
jgi:hypothetical protein